MINYVEFGYRFVFLSGTLCLCGDLKCAVLEQHIRTYVHVRKIYSTTKHGITYTYVYIRTCTLTAVGLIDS